MAAGMDSQTSQLKQKKIAARERDQISSLNYEKELLVRYSDKPRNGGRMEIEECFKGTNLIK